MTTRASSAAEKHPVQSIRVARETKEWLSAMTDQGAIIIGAKGRLSLEPRVRTLLEGLHVVLSGGEVEVKMVRRGRAALKKRLDAKLANALRASGRLTAADDGVLYP